MRHVSDDEPPVKLRGQQLLEKGRNGSIRDDLGGG